MGRIDITVLQMVTLCRYINSSLSLGSKHKHQRRTIWLSMPHTVWKVLWFPSNVYYYIVPLGTKLTMSVNNSRVQGRLGFRAGYLLELITMCKYPNCGQFISFICIVPHCASK